MSKLISNRILVLILMIALIMSLMMGTFTGCKKKIDNPTPGQSANPTTTPDTGGNSKIGPYKKLAIIGDFPIVTQLEAKGFTNVVGLDGWMHGGISRRNFWGNEKYIDHPDTPDKNEAAIYWTVPLVKGDMLKFEKYMEYIDAGHVPWTWADNNADSLNIASFPRDIDTVIIANWFDNTYAYKEGGKDRTKDGVSVEWTEDLCEYQFKVVLQKIKNWLPNARVYVCSLLPMPEDVGLFNADKWPNSRFSGQNIDDVPSLKCLLGNNWKESSDVIKAWAQANDVTFIDVMGSDLVDDNGYLKEEYVHPYGWGQQLSKEGIIVYGNLLMDAVGLQKPMDVAEYKDWYK